MNNMKRNTLEYAKTMHESKQRDQVAYSTQDLPNQHVHLCKSVTYIWKHALPLLLL